MPISEETIKKVKLDNPGVELELLCHDKLDVQALAKVPPRGIYTIFLQMHTDGRSIEANEMLCQAAIVYPDKAGLQEMLDEHPALVGVWTGEIREMAGATGGAYRKKV